MINLLILPDEFSLFQFNRDYKPNASWFDTLEWYTVSRTRHELSVLCPTEAAASVASAANKCEGGWRCFQVDAQMDFGLVGILASIVDPLRDNKIPVFVVSTYDTDYVLVKQDTLEKAMAVLNKEKEIVIKPGHSVL